MAEAGFNQQHWGWMFSSVKATTESEKIIRRKTWL
jgi:hypothetical protein